MKKDSNGLGIPLSRRLVRLGNNSRDLRLPRDLSLAKRTSVGARKIFVVNQTSDRPAATTAAGKMVQRILIFDNHPDSLRLIFGRRAASHVHFSDSQRTMSWGVALLWILVVGLMMAMFWPLS